MKMDVTSMLNAGMAASMAVGRKDGYERQHSEEGNSTGPVQTPSATAGSTAPSSMATTPTLERTSPRQMGEVRLYSRSRTPWDAGGFSLSRALDARKVARLSPGAVAFSASGMATPHGDVVSSPPETADLGGCSPKSNSPRHKFSDSRSSFSSTHTFSSSTNSVSHSRLSSLSTVSENQPLAALITDFSQLETRISDPFSGCPLQQVQQQYSSCSETPDRNEDFQIGSPTPVRSRHNLPYEGSPEQSPRSLERPQSPSDAVLIPRPGNDAMVTPGNTGLNTSAGHARPHSRNHYLHLDSAPKRRHKRAVSAPDFSSIIVSSFNPRFPTFGPIPEPTPSPSQDSDGNAMEQDMPIGLANEASMTGRSVPSLSSDPTLTTNGSGQEMPSSTDTSPVTPGSVSHQTGETTALPADDSAEPEPVCMYRGDCQTGSQLRKAISHIFGRNKLCTRMIPTGVWVHYCRKHYQRTRYRNGGEYPQRQIGLVQEQIKRVQAWSDANQRRAKGPVLVDWSLAVRKREQMRLDSKMAATGKKRPFQEDAEEEEEEGYDEDRSDLSGTAVPDWIVRDIGKDYKTNEIMAIVEHLKQDIDQGRLQQIPDIEILPNILPDKENNEVTANAKKQANKRRPNASHSSNFGGMGASGPGHRRTQSVNTAALHLNSVSMDRRRSQPGSFMNPYTGGNMPQRVLHNGDLQPPVEKRQRLDSDRVDRHGNGNGNFGYESFESLEALSGGGQQPPPVAGIHSRTSPGGRMQLAHRPAFSEIREDQADVHSYHHPLPGEPRGEQHLSPSTSLAGPYEDPQRYGSGAYGFGGRQDYYDQQAAGPSASTGYGVLPAPNPQRHGSSSMAQRLEISSYALNSVVPRRSNMHLRSQSEAAFYPRPTSSSGPSAYLPMPGNGNANASANTNNTAHRDQEPTGYGGYAMSQMYGRGNRYETENRGSVGGHGNESYERYDSVQLPPLQCLPPLHSHQRGGMDRKYGSAAGYSETKHVRHQSSPVVPRMLPSPMEVVAGSQGPRETGRTSSP